MDETFLSNQDAFYFFAILARILLAIRFSDLQHKHKLTGGQGKIKMAFTGGFCPSRGKHILTRSQNKGYEGFKGTVLGKE